jgi:membrane protein DedA with SNARE-associated domain
MQTFDLTRLAIDLLSTLGYGGLLVGLVLDSFGLPIPSEVLLVLGGALAAHGRFNIVLVFLLGVAGQVLGGLIAYGIGRYGGLPVLERYGKYLLVSKRDLAKTHEAFEKYGALMAMAGRCIPIVRGLIGYPAGIAGMPVGKFILYTTIGSAVWTALFVGIGFSIGDNLGGIGKVISAFSIVIILAGVVGIAWHTRDYIKKWMRRA